MKADSQVSIVIPNYNGMAFMEACMQAVLRDAPKAELIVVDNASKDGSLEYTREHFPEARVLAMDQNYGFARAVNEGIRAATRPYVILLNNDTEVEPGFTDALVGALDKIDRPRPHRAGDPHAGDAGIPQDGQHPPLLPRLPVQMGDQHDCPYP